MTTKLFLSQQLRRLHLFAAADTVRFAASQVQHYRDNRAFRIQHPQFAPPPAWCLYDAAGSVNYRWYHESGLESSAVILRLIGKWCPAQPEVAEWGCGQGRILRHLTASINRLHGFDYNPQSIAWCRRHIAGVEFHTNQLRPPLDLEDSRLDAVYCYSVFTHLSPDLQQLWASELRRILKPGGVLISTFQCDHSPKRILPAEMEKLKSEGVLIRTGSEGKRQFVAVHTEDYIRDVLLRDFAFCEKIEVSNPKLFQTFFVFQKPRTGPAGIA